MFVHRSARAAAAWGNVVTRNGRGCNETCARVRPARKTPVPNGRPSTNPPGEDTAWGRNVPGQQDVVLDLCLKARHEPSASRVSISFRPAFGCHAQPPGGSAEAVALPIAERPLTLEGASPRVARGANRRYCAKGKPCLAFAVAARGWLFLGDGDQRLV